MYEREIEDANRVLNNTFIFNNPWDMEQTHTPWTFKTQIDWNLVPFDDEEWTFMLARFSFLQNLKVAYLATGEDKYIEKGKALINDFIINNPLDASNKNKSWRTLDSAIRIHSFLNFPHSDTALFKNSIKEHCLYLKSVNTDFLALSNWGTIGYAYLVEGALFLQDLTLAEDALARFSENLRYSVLEDGMQFEQSPMYHVEVLLSLLDLIRCTEKYNYEINPEIRQVAHKMLLFMLTSMTADKKQFLQADSDDTNIEDVLSYGALTLKDGLFKTFGLTKLPITYSQEDRELYNSLPLIQPSFTSKCLFQSGNTYLRSSWTKDAVVTHFKTGHMGSGHGHSDLLHLDVSYKDINLLVDSGRFTYTEKPIRYELKSAFSHNTIVQDNIDFTKISDSWGFKKRADTAQVSFYENSNYAYVVGFNFGYSNTIIKREVIQIKDIAIVIFDSLFSDKEHEYSRYFHFDNKYKLEKAANFIKYGDSKLWFDEQKEMSNIHTTSYSKHYNSLEEKETVVLASKGVELMLATVLTLKPEAKVSLEKLKLLKNNTNIENSYGIDIQSGADTIHMLATIRNEIYGIGFIKDSKMKGYGRIIASINGQYEAISI